MIRFALAALIPILAGAPMAGAAMVRRPATDVQVSLAKVPKHNERKAAQVGRDGRFRVEELASGTWTMTVSVPEGYLEKWITAELKSRRWTRGNAPPATLATASTQGDQAAAGEKPVPGASVHGIDGTRTGEGGSREFRLVATDDKGGTHELKFSLVVTVENTANGGGMGGGGDYVKPMRWNQLESGLSFKFAIGKDAGGVIAGMVERVLEVGPAAPPAAAAR